MTLVARAGEVAPGTSDNFTRFVSPTLNDVGQMAFQGRLNSNSNSHGIWSEGGGSGLALVARAGEVAPGTSDTFSHLGFPVFNDAGQTAFSGGLRDSAYITDGIWAEDQAGVLTLIARAGELLDVDDGPGTDFRTIRDLNFSDGTDSQTGRPSSFNNLGQLAFRASFTDGTSGVFISNLVAIPEPSTCVLLAMFAVGFVGTGRRA